MNINASSILLVFILYINLTITSASKCSYSRSERYYRGCGLWNWSRCSAKRYSAGYRCCSGWTGSSCSTPVCGSINNCDQVQCLSPNNVICNRCDGEYGSELGNAYAKSSDSKSCIEQCSWRSDSNACYPGFCSNGNCQCAAGFTGTDCRTMPASQSPTISYASAQLQTMNTVVESTTASPVYTNIQQITSVRLNWIGSYQPTGLPSYESIPYINGVTLGVVSAFSAITVTGSFSHSQPIQCPDAGSSSNPITGIVDCDVTNDELPTWNVQSGDVMTIEFQLLSGGYMELFNRDSGNSIIKRFYRGATTTESVSFNFDVDPPEHCAGTDYCACTMFNVGNDITSDNVIDVSWRDWSDTHSSIHSYHLEVRRMAPHGSNLSESYHEEPAYDNTTSSDINNTTVVLPGAGMYSFVLSVIDVAGNQKLARRFLLFNNGTSGTDVNQDNPIHVSSAEHDHDDTNFQWITNVGTPTTQVELTWEGHFESTFYQRLFIPIGDHRTGLIKHDYDQTTGTLNRNGVPNQLGVTEFRSYFEVDHSGGSTLIDPSIANTNLWQSESLNVSQTYNVGVIDDGDSIQFWIEARDIMGHSTLDSVLVHVDSSPPRIEEFWLQRDGEAELAVHNTDNLRDMRIHFKAYDIHSGLRTIQYELHDTANDTVKMHKALPVVKVDPNNCEPTTCVCIPLGECYQTDFEIVPEFHIGKHDYDYVIKLMVTNNAHLISNNSLKITIDTSPPIAGSVHDGTPEDNDIDFQEKHTLYVHWDGFFDKESGVKLYEYVFDSQCWDTMTSLNEHVFRSTSTQASWTAHSPGKYYATVVAYNHALDPSTAVCSDGVTIDTTPPNLSDVHIENSKIKPGIVVDNDDNIWFVNSKVEYKRVINGSELCRSNARSAYGLTWFQPFTHHDDITLDDCDMRGPSGNQLFISADKHISVSWNGWDEESDIYDFYIGLNSLPSDLLPDIMPYVSTSGKDNFTLQHPSISHGTVFYLIVKVVNKAQMSSSRIFGPVVVDITPPKFGGSITTSLTPSYIEVCWESSSFFDDIDNDLLYEMSIGSRGMRGNADVLPYTNIATFTDQCNEANSICVKIPRERLLGELHANHEYHVTIKASNTAGLSVIAESPEFTGLLRQPSGGVVLDMLPANEESPGTKLPPSDVDVQMSSSSIRAHWFGFHHPHRDLTYFFAVGSRPGHDDISDGQVFVGNKIDHEEIGLHLQYLKTYYVSITAVCETGNVTVTSDGITPIEQDADLHHSICVHDGLTDCEGDINSQLTTSVVQVSWNISSLGNLFVTNVFWSLEKRRASTDETIPSTWLVYKEYMDLGFADSYIETGLTLEHGGYYRSKVKFCYHSICYKPLATDGFWVVTEPPVGRSVNVDSQRDSNNLNIDVYFEGFQDVTGIMDHYEWTLADSLQDDAPFFPWRIVTDMDSDNDRNHFSIHVNEPYHLHCISVLLRGYNPVGLSTTVSTSLECRQDSGLIVIDSNHDITPQQRNQWIEPDKDYVKTMSKMSAVWPSLRHHDYIWAVVDDNNGHDFQAGLRYPCEFHQTLKCGHTENEYVNVDGLELLEGHRYRICIHANEISIGQTLPAVSACSNGVIVDTLPPTTGKVWVGQEEETAYYQVSKSEVVVKWEHFTDVETSDAIYHSGIQSYDLAIGTEPGKDNVASSYNVGYTNRSIIAHLDLNNDIVYYATVRGTDLMGLTSVSSSNTFSIDNTPPSVNRRSTLSVDSAFFRSTSSIAADWSSIFWDDQSGIDYYEWAIGTKPGYSDIVPFSRASDPMIPYGSLNADLKDGHPYFITIKATNRMGLTTSKSFGAFRVESTPPTAGHVYDTISSTPLMKDYDWATSTSHLCASWEGFHDPHSSIVGYSWQIGLCKGCGDVQTQQFVGMTNSTCANHVGIIPDFKYYVTITACNAADLCTSVTSDGITFDNSPPAIGKVYDGESGDDVTFSPHRYHISAHWWEFNDPQSKISHYEWRAGTTPKSDDIMKPISAHHSEFAFNVLESSLPIDVTIFITVRAYNRAGLWAEASSDGFMVDDTEPTIVRNVTRDVTFGNENSQIPNDIIRISWDIDDAESSIRRQLIQLMSHFKGDVDTYSVEIGPSDKQYTLANLSLHYGSRYRILIIACNGAGLCTTSSSEEFLVDSTPPTVGTFAIETEHAANLRHHHDGWMTWSYNKTEDTTILRLAWLGFSDLHSRISYYSLTIGSNFDDPDIGKVEFDASSDIDDFKETEIQLNGSTCMNEYDRIYVSVSATNEVGLQSSRAFSAFDLAPSGSGHEGMLELVRRCEAHSCEGHCVCAPVDKLCPVVLGDCIDISEGNPNEEVEVIDVLQVIHSKDTTSDISIQDDINFSPSTSYIAAIWKIKIKKGLPILRYEWSVGLDWSEGSKPQGVYDPAMEQVWHDIGQDTGCIVTFDKAHAMLPGETYQIFIRAWYSDVTYAVFRSDGVTPYPFAPKASALKGAYVNDITDGSKTDVDFSTNPNSISTSWHGVFIQNQQALQKFEVALGTFPGGDDIRQFSDNALPTTETNYAFTNLHMKSGQRYFASVRAYNKAGLHTTLSSDGFIVDTKTPRTGVVSDGNGLQYLEYQTSVTTVSASWHGFYDLESYIDYHVWCVGTTNQFYECSVIASTNTGLSVTVERDLDSTLTPGHRYFSSVFAVDAAGLQSQTIVSKGFIPDITPPVPLAKTESSVNVISNPSFEDEPLEWDVHPVNSSHILSVGKGNAKDGTKVMLVNGEITASVTTVPGNHYRLTFFTSHVSSDENIFLHQEGLVIIPGEERVFKLYHRENHGITDSNLWQRNEYHFVAEETDSVISLKSLGGNGIYVDQISIHEITYQTSDSPTLVDIQLQMFNGHPVLHASWRFQDNESPIKDYMWAIGTVRGGTQLQDFTSIGDKTYAHTMDLSLINVATVFVSVVARNKAGLTGIAYSKSILVDFTAPEIVYVREDGEFFYKDLDYTKEFTFQVSWESRDEESEIVFCDWGVGLQPGSDDAKTFALVVGATGTQLAVNLPENTNEGQTFYVTVSCQNSAGLSSSSSSNGVTVVTTAPDSSHAFVNIIATSETEYDLIDEYQSHTDYIKGYWKGFSDVYGIKYYQCKITGPMISDSRWENCGTTVSTSATLEGLFLVPGSQYHMEVRAVNFANLESSSVGSNVTVITEPPKITGDELAIRWQNNDTLTLFWEDAFISITHLWYEVSIGTIYGGSDVMQWVETTETKISVSPLKKLTDYYITLTAVNSVGLSATINVLFNW